MDTVQGRSVPLHVRAPRGVDHAVAEAMTHHAHRDPGRALRGAAPHPGPVVRAAVGHGRRPDAVVRHD